MRLVEAWCLQHVCETCITAPQVVILPTRTALPPFSCISLKAWQIYSLPNYRLFPCFQIEIVRSHSIYHLRRPHLPSSRLLLPRTGHSKRWTIELKEPSPSTANCSDLTSHEGDVLLDNSSSKYFSHSIKPPKRPLSECYLCGTYTDTKWCDRDFTSSKSNTAVFASSNER